MISTAWTGTLAFGPWWLMYCGPIGPTELHAHHAFQIVVHEGDSCLVDGAGEAIDGPIAIVEPDQHHAIRASRERAVVVFVEPESSAGANLRRRGPAVVLQGLHSVSEVIGASTPDNWSRADEAVRRTLAMAGVSEPAAPLRWWRHPAVDEALLRLPDLVDDGRVDFSELAATIGVSTSRLTHVFSAEVGIPLRSYARWLRLVRATESLAEGASITEAAHDARFADGAHFSRVFREMFGLTPSEVMLAGSWVR